MRVKTTLFFCVFLAVVALTWSSSAQARGFRYANGYSVGVGVRVGPVYAAPYYYRPYRSYYGPRYYSPSVYYRPRYYSPSPYRYVVPATVYVQPATTYVQPAPVYVQPTPATQQQYDSTPTTTIVPAPPTPAPVQVSP
jgi:hypothetical protein